jgi:sulfate permease, SulP family
MRGYQRAYLRGDLFAGAVVAVMLVPQGMAYAMLAGLPPVVGLYASTIPVFVYALFGSSRQLAVGPVAIISLLLAARFSALAEPGSAEYVGIILTVALLVGVIQLAMGLLRLGFLTHFISHAVMSGFTSAAAVIIILSQMGPLLGVDLGRAHSVGPLMMEIVSRMRDAHVLTLVTGVGAIAVLVVFRMKAPRFPSGLLLVAAATALTFFMGLHERGLAIVGAVPMGLPSFAMPGISPALALPLLTTALTIVFVGFIESVAIGEIVAAKENYRLDVNQELRALGLANAAAGFFSGCPVSGGFSRTAVNHEAGAKTPLASTVSATLVLLTLLFLTPLFRYLPKAALAAVVIVAVSSLIDVRQAVYLFRLRKADGVVLLVTFLATLLAGVQTGVLSGVALSLAQFIWRSAHPHMAELGYLAGENVFRNIKRYPKARVFPNALILRIDASLYFANLEFVEQYIRERLAGEGGIQWVILDMSGVNDMDAVAISAIEKLMENYKDRGIVFLFAALKGPVRDLIARAGWPERYGQRVACTSIVHALREAGMEIEGRQERTRNYDVS